MSRPISDEEINSMVDEDLAEAYEHEQELKALQFAINSLSDPLLRRILTKIVELMS